MSMNLLTDPWVPVLHEGQFQHVSLCDVLTREESWRLCLPRDDLELAALQMLICFAQTLFLPRDAEELIAREAQPMSTADYENAIVEKADWFDLFHPTQPFMQTRGVKASELTPIQKLFPGLPAGNNHAHFNTPSEMTSCCPSCVAIAMFNQATCCPSLGGGFKGPLRGNTPVTTLLTGTTLRKEIWRNIIPCDSIESQCIPQAQVDQPNWVQPVERGETFASSELGLIRGLFWQPLRMELVAESREGDRCSHCGASSKTMVTGFAKEKFVYTMFGSWPHPHSPQSWRKPVSGEGDQPVPTFCGLNAMGVAWTQLGDFVIPKQLEQVKGSLPAGVIRSHEKVWGDEMTLIVGGYRNKQAAITQRRHDLVSLSSGWSRHVDTLSEVVELGMAMGTALRSKMYGFGKEVGVTGLADLAQARYYQRSESLIHATLHNADWEQMRGPINTLADALASLVRRLFKEIVAPYISTPQGLQAQATTRRTLNGAIRKILNSVKGE